nr:unnamed protein product [Callosobruchus analis]
MGPSAISALMTFQVIHGYGPEHAILLCFLTGIVQFLMGVFGLGPVSSGFTSAVALIIVTSQMKDVLGIHVQSSGGSTFIGTWRSIFQDIHKTQAWDTTLGVVCIAVLLMLRIIGSIKLGSTEKGVEPTKFQKFANASLWLIGTARNAILVVVIGVVPQGLPDLKLPPFGYEREINANGKMVDATQEFIAIGVCNICNSFVQAFPSTGSLSRSAVNNSSGVRTPLGGLYTSLLVILALLFFTPYFFFIPKAALGALIIAAVIFMVEVKVVKPMWRSKKSDLILGFTTFIACLVLALEIGILVGVGINLLFILYHAARPKITSRAGTEYLMLTPDRCLIFPSVDYVRNLVTKHSIRQGIPVVIDCSHIYGADYTAATDFSARNQPLFFYNLKPSVSSVFAGVSPKDFVSFYNEDEIDILLKNRSYLKNGIKEQMGSLKA